MPRRHRFALLSLFLFTSLAWTACAKLEPNGFPDADDTDTGTVDTGDDTTVEADADADDGTGEDTADLADDGGETWPDPPTHVETSCMGDLEQNTTRGEPVVADLCAWMDDGASGATLVQIDDEAQLLEGPTAMGRLGDYLFDTGKARFVIHGPDRRSQPCPFGGTIVDGSYLRDDGTWTPDNVGEVCTLVQVGRTIDPDADDFEILADGADGGPAVLAVTSRDVLSDWLNLKGNIKEYVGDLITLPINPDDDFGLTITQYFIAEPGASYLTVLTGIRNDSDDEQSLLLGDIIDSGGVVQFFNPESTKAGFGYESITPEEMSLLAFVAEDSSHAFVPLVRGFDETGQVEVDSSYLAVSGVAVPVLGTTNLLSTALAPRFRNAEGVVNLTPGFWATWERRFYVGDGDLSTITDPVHAWHQQPGARVTGRVVDPDGNPVADVPVAAIKTLGSREQTETRFRTNANGEFAGWLPVGDTYRVVADPDDRVMVGEVAFEVAEGEDIALSDVVVSAPGRLDVTVTHGLDDSPLPARVTVICEGECPRPRSRQLRDVSFDGLPPEVAAVVYTAVDGTASVPLPPGDYRVVVSRGMTWTVWPMGGPEDAPDAAAMAITVAGDGTPTTVAAELLPAVDTTGYIGADFHVHAINSPDAPVDNYDRVRSFLAAGVDLMISTDHDYITDYAPYVRELGAEGLAATMVGVELTTFDYGHYNSFPLVADPTDITGGAIDWAVEDAPPLYPSEIFQALRDHSPGERIIQVNHGEGGYFSAIHLDAARQISKRDPTDFRMPPVEPGPDGDTGLWSDGFTSMEVLNGTSLTKFWSLMNWWFAMEANGFKPAITASSDTHRLLSDSAGHPRTWVHVGEGVDTIATFDPAIFVAATNGQQAFGTSGPFVHLSAVNTGGDRIDVGQTLASSPGETVTLEVDVQTPIWMRAGRVRLFGNVLDSSPLPGEVNEEAPEALASVDLVWDEATHLVRPFDVQGPPQPETSWRQTVTFEVAPTEDGFYLVVVDTPDNVRTMFPVIASAGTPTFAFTNPIYIDVDGGGYDAPGAIPAPIGMGGSGQTLPQTPRPLTWEDIDTIREAIEAEHGH